MPCSCCLVSSLVKFSKGKKAKRKKKNLRVGNDLRKLFLVFSNVGWVLDFFLLISVYGFGTQNRSKEILYHGFESFYNKRTSCSSYSKTNKRFGGFHDKTNKEPIVF